MTMLRTPYYYILAGSFLLASCATHSRRESPTPNPRLLPSLAQPIVLRDLVGVAIDSLSGKPLASLPVLVRQLSPQSDSAITLSDSLGIFAFHALRPGDYSVAFRALGYCPGPLTVRVPPAQGFMLVAFIRPARCEHLAPDYISCTCS